MRRLRADDGFTLPELLTTMAIAMIVSLATFSLVELVMKRSGEVSARVETTAAARTAMDQITRQLRSQVCAKRTDMSAARSLAAASPTSVSVFADFTSENLDGTLPAADLREVTWSDNRFTETVTAGVRDTAYNTVSYQNGTPVTRVLTDSVAPAQWSGGDPKKPVIFRYYKYPEPPSGQSILPRGSTPNVEVTTQYRALTDAELESVAKITVDFTVLPKSGSASGATTLKNEVYVRTTDPNAAIPKPTCLTY